MSIKEDMGAFVGATLCVIVVFYLRGTRMSTDFFFGLFVAFIIVGWWALFKWLTGRDRGKENK